MIYFRLLASTTGSWLRLVKQISCFHNCAEQLISRRAGAGCLVPASLLSFDLLLPVSSRSQSTLGHARTRGLLATLSVISPHLRSDHNMISQLTIALLTLQTAAGKTFYQHNPYQVNQSPPERRKVFSTPGENITLSCTNPSPWFFCVWEGPRGDRICGLRDKLGSDQDQLCGEDHRFSISG